MIKDIKVDKFWYRALEAEIKRAYLLGYFDEDVWKKDSNKLPLIAKILKPKK